MEYFGSFSNIHFSRYKVHMKKTKERCIFRHNYYDISVEKFKYKLHIVNTNSSDTNNTYDNFIKMLKNYSVNYSAFYQLTPVR